MANIHKCYITKSYYLLKLCSEAFNSEMILCLGCTLKYSSQLPPPSRGGDK